MSSAWRASSRKAEDLRIHCDLQTKMEDASGGGFSIWLLLLFTLLILLALFGNLLVVASIFWDRALRRQPENLFLVSLAVSDLLVSVLVMVFAASNDLLGYWPFGAVYCQFWICFDITCCTASILNLCAISLDRYWHISRPMVYVRYCNRRRIYYAIIIVWLISALIGAAPLGFGIGSNVSSYSNVSHPACEMKLPLPYAIASSLLSFFVPAAVMVLLYTKLYLYARRHVRSIRTQLKQATSFLIMQLASEKIREVTAATLNGERLGSTAGLGSSALEQPRACLVSSRPAAPSSTLLLHTPNARVSTVVTQHPTSSSASKFMNLTTWDKLVRLLPSSKREKASSEHPTPSNQTKNISDQKARLTLGVIMGTFLFCWLPFFLVNIWRSWTPDKVNHQIILAVTWLGYANSTANPLIYSIFNRDFRRAFKKIIIEMFRCCEDRKLNKSHCSSRQMVNVDVERRKASCTRSSESHGAGLENNNVVFAGVPSSSSAGESSTATAAGALAGGGGGGGGVGGQPTRLVLLNNNNSTVIVEDR